MTVHKTYGAEFKAVGTGKVEALVSIFGNVDLVGDRVVKGAFEKSIQRWKAAGDPIPVVFSHQWDNVMSHIGVVEDIEETDRGLKAIYTLDVEDNPVAAQVYRLMKRRTLKEHSFAYEIKTEKRAKDGANELLELDIIEVGPTLRGANPETELLAVKAAIEEQKYASKPWHIEERDGRFCVIKDSDGESEGCHDTMEEAMRQMRALYSSEKSGRAISAKTESVIRGVIDQLAELLASQEDTGSAAGEKSEEPEAKTEEPAEANVEEPKDASIINALAAIAAEEAALKG